MTDDKHDDGRSADGSGSGKPAKDYAEWKEGHGADVDPRERFRQASHIALCMSYDLIDKLRYWEKETLNLPEEEIEKRLPHLVTLLDRLRTAYVGFSDVDL